MDRITLQELVQAVRGDLLRGDPAQEITGVCTDTRQAGEGDVFFALTGERDGHDFIPAALTAGAAGCVVSRDVTETVGGSSAFLVRVEDTTRALGDLARWYRGRFDIPVIGVTGSVGKTTTKETIAAVLGARFRTLKTQGNFNNHLGVPLTIFGLDSSCEAAVIEMGMNHPGEIRYLTGIARPTMAVITNIGDAHLENMGSRENTLRAKCEIFEGMPRGSAAVFSGDDELLTALPEDVSSSLAEGDHRILYVGTEENCIPGTELTLRAVQVRDRLADRVECDASSADGTTETLSIPALGGHMVYPMLMAAAVGRELGLTWEEIRRGMRAYTAAPMRMQVISREGVTLINDAYNANPQSMKNALRILSNISRLETGTWLYKVAVLGDMLELGPTEESLHREIGSLAATLDIDLLIAVGPRGRWIADGARDAVRDAMQGIAGRVSRGYRLRIVDYPERDDAREKLRQVLDGAGTDPSDRRILLFKGSRGMRMEELCNYAATL